jgi:uncharacterized membrane protein
MKAQVPIPTPILYMIVRGILVLLFWSILISPVVSGIPDKTIQSVISIIVFIIALAFVIGGGKGTMVLGQIFRFSR